MHSADWLTRLHTDGGRLARSHDSSAPGSVVAISPRRGANKPVTFGWRLSRRLESTLRTPLRITLARAAHNVTSLIPPLLRRVDVPGRVVVVLAAWCILALAYPPTAAAQSCNTDGDCQSGKCCAHQCVDTNTDSFNCGTCDNDCTLTDFPDCCAGRCVDTTLDPQNCDTCGTVCTSGCCDLSECVDTTTDPSNCGTCGNDCTLTDFPDCCAGRCVDTTVDPQNCGTCGNVCTSGCCTLTGVCADLKSDPANCGTCAHQCGQGQTCCSGQCVPGGCAPTVTPTQMVTLPTMSPTLPTTQTPTNTVASNPTPREFVW